MLKTMASSVLIMLAHIKINKNELNINGISGIDDSRINNKIANLSSSAKKISSKTGFLTPKTSLSFI